MRKIFGIICMMTIALANTAISQVVKFTYDDAGNRIKREVVTVLEMRQQEESEIPKFIKSMDLETLANVSIDESSNNIHVEFSETETTTINTSIYSIAGYKCYEAVFKSPVFDVEIGKLPKGAYILVLTIDNRSKAWKIIKE